MKDTPAPTRGAIAPAGGYRWGILTAIYLTFLASAVVFQSVPPVLGLIAGDLSLSHSEAGLLMSLFALPGVFLSIPMGLLAGRYDARRLIVSLLVAQTLGTLLVAGGPSFDTSPLPGYRYLPSPHSRREPLYRRESTFSAGGRDEPGLGDPQPR